MLQQVCHHVVLVQQVMQSLRLSLLVAWQAPHRRRRRMLLFQQPRLQHMEALQLLLSLQTKAAIP
jgi:hypothetical protein